MNPENENDQETIADCRLRIAKLKRAGEFSGGYRLEGMAYHIGKRDDFEFVAGGLSG